MILIAAALAFAVTLPAAPAQAQAIRTFVSVAGSDSNPCSLTQPCRHFQAAVNATAVGGEVDALDPGAYGSFTISHAITIEGQGWSYVAPPANGAAISINAAGANVNIRGVSLNGVGVANTLGIQFIAGASLNVQDSVIRNFTDEGIYFGPNAASRLFVSNTLISDIVGLVGDGIEIFPTGSGTTTGVLNHVQLVNNSNDGLFVGVTNTAPINVTVSDCVSADNGANGVHANSGNGGSVSIMVRNSTIANNGVDGLLAQLSGATVRVTRSTITGNAVGWTFGSPGAVLSYGDNNIDGNMSANTQPPCVNGTSPCTAYH
jgi:hypothetical protein